MSLSCPIPPPPRKHRTSSYECTPPFFSLSSQVQRAKVPWDRVNEPHLTVDPSCVVEGLLHRVGLVQPFVGLFPHHPGSRLVESTVPHKGCPFPAPYQHPPPHTHPYNASPSPHSPWGVAGRHHHFFDPSLHQTSTHEVCGHVLSVHQGPAGGGGQQYADPSKINSQSPPSEPATDDSPRQCLKLFLASSLNVSSFSSDSMVMRCHSSSPYVRYHWSVNATTHSSPLRLIT